LSRSLILSEGATPVLEGQVLQLASTVGVPRAFQASWKKHVFLNPAQWFFGFFVFCCCFFLGFLRVFKNIFAQKREFLGFFQFPEYF
jgi:hypothetical protein